MAIVTGLDVSTYWLSLDIIWTDGRETGHIEHPKPAIVEASSVSAAAMTDISDSIGTLLWRINGEDDLEADQEVALPTVGLPDSLGSGRMTLSQPIAHPTLVGSWRAILYADARVNVVPT